MIEPYEVANFIIGNTSKSLSSKSDEKADYRERNRIAAQNSRRRKKEYAKHLEEKVERLEKKISELNRKIENLSRFSVL